MLRTVFFQTQNALSEIGQGVGFWLVLLMGWLGGMRKAG
jgi:hypothetical protein